VRYLPALALIGLLAACGGTAASEPDATKTAAVKPTKPDTFSASGYIDVDGRSAIMAATGTRGCVPESGYDDVTPGAQVTVTSPKGDVVAVGRLDTGDKHGAFTCRFPFTVEDIPIGSKLYSVEVSHRGALTYTQAEMEAGLAFTLQ
jgi:hypothetical protein